MGISGTTITSSDRGIITGSDRLPAIAGIAYILVSVTAVYFEFSAPDVLDTPAEVASGFVAARSAAITAATLLLVASALFLVFLVGLSALLHRVEDARPTRTPLAGFTAIAGACSIAVLVAYIAMYGALVTSIVGAVEPRTLLALLRVANAFDGMSSFFQGAMVLAASLALLRRPRLFPGWIGWLGLPTAACASVPTITFGTDRYLPALGAIGALSIPLYVVWVLALNITILMKTQSHGRARDGHDAR